MAAAKNDKNARSSSAQAAVGEDRRRHARVEITLDGHFIHENGAEEPCTVSNISAGGALLRTNNPPTVGDAVVVHIDTIGRFEGKVVRASRNTFAVDYRGRRAKSKATAEALMHALHHGPKIADQRQAPKIRTTSTAIVEIDGEPAATRRILDISLTGATVEVSPPPELGALLTVGKMRARVVRRFPNGVGVIFTGAVAKRKGSMQESENEKQTNGSKIAEPFGKRGVPDADQN